MGGIEELGSPKPDDAEALRAREERQAAQMAQVSKTTM